MSRDLHRNIRKKGALRLFSLEKRSRWMRVRSNVLARVATIFLMPVEISSQIISFWQLRIERMEIFILTGICQKLTLTLCSNVLPCVWCRSIRQYEDDSAVSWDQFHPLNSIKRGFVRKVQARNLSTHLAQAYETSPWQFITSSTVSLPGYDTVYHHQRTIVECA